MTSDIRVRRGSKIAHKMGLYRVGQGRKVGQKWQKKSGTSLMDVPYVDYRYILIYFMNSPL
jgi:hypothetical protein